MAPGPVWAIVVAAGGGSRYGGHKQFDPLAGRPVVGWAVERARAASDGVVVVVPAEQLDEAPPADAVVAGGPTRSASVRAGLAAVPTDAEVVIVHDAARPFAPEGLFEATVAAVRAGATGAVPGLPVADTLKAVDPSGRVTATVPRGDIVIVQTPQAFQASALRAAHGSQVEATDDAGLIEAAGGTVVVVPGDRLAAKITEPQDLTLLECLAGQGER